MPRKEHAKIDGLATQYDSDDSIGNDGTSVGAMSVEEMRRASRRINRAGDSAIKFSTNPATLAVVAATATIAPPLGATVAGLFTSGMGLVVGVLKVAGPTMKAADKIMGSKVFKTIKKLLKTKKQLRIARQRAARAQAQARGAAKKVLNDGVKKAAKLIAKQCIKANRGDKKAQAEIIALQIAYKSPQALRKLVSGRPKSAEKFLKAAIKKAGILRAKFEAKRPPPKKTKARNKRIQKKASRVVKKALTTVQKKAKRSLTIKRSGILVDSKGKSRKGKYNGKGKQLGYLVTGSGKVTRGKWGRA